MERYEGSVYGTFESGAHYLDVVARFGRVNNDFYTSNAAVSKSGVFHQKYAALSAEYGYKFDTGLGFFVEPQVQGQAAYLGSYDANVGGTMNMEADSTTSFIGRVGMRMGKTIWTEAVAAEVYARADVLHQFTDGQDAVQRNNKGERLDVTWGDAGTWYNYGVGGYCSWTWKRAPAEKWTTPGCSRVVSITTSDETQRCVVGETRRHGPRPFVRGNTVCAPRTKGV